MSAARYIIDPRDERNVLDTMTGNLALHAGTRSALAAIELLEAGARREQWVWRPQDLYR